MVDAEEIHVEVVYALSENACVISFAVPKGTTLCEAVERSGILQRFKEIDLSRNRVGIFSQLCDPDTVLAEGDRVEIYRPLKVDPKEARRRRAGKKASAG